MAFVVALATVFALGAEALKIHHGGNTSAVTAGEPVTFQKYYEDHKEGRGIWKWNNALTAYQRHFGSLAGQPLAVAEVGVQSGGSMLMWKNVLGPHINLHGLDINPNCKQFEEPNVTITIGDQGDITMWNNFYATVSTTGLDILVDDGGHMANQMLTTLQAAFPHVHAGGYVVIEDIVGAHYLDSFFKPTAAFLAQHAQAGEVDSVHIYPLVLITRKGGFAADSPLASEGVLQFSGPAVAVTDYTAMWSAISTAAPGSHIVLQNPAWDNYFLQDSLVNFFSGFIGLHEGTFEDTPKGCSTTPAPVCTNEIKPLSHLQLRVSGVHIYKERVVVEIPAQQPWVAAVRKGTEWIHYGR